jgi:hypothetical protein
MESISSRPSFFVVRYVVVENLQLFTLFPVKLLPWSFPTISTAMTGISIQFPPEDVLLEIPVAQCKPTWP